MDLEGPLHTFHGLCRVLIRGKVGGLGLFVGAQGPWRPLYNPQLMNNPPLTAEDLNGAGRWLLALLMFSSDEELKSFAHQLQKNHAPFIDGRRERRTGD